MSYFGLLIQVISRFYEIRQQSLDELEDKSWDDKCALLLHEPAEMWSFNDTSTSKYIVSLISLKFHSILTFLATYDIFDVLPRVILFGC